MKTYPHKSARAPGHARERGAILIVSLLILLVLTLLGLTGLSNMTLEERMAGNYQQRTIAFQAAESKISETIFRGSQESETNPGAANPQYLEASDPIRAAMVNGSYGPKTEAIDSNDDIPNANVNVVIEVKYMGIDRSPDASPGNEINTFPMGVFEIHANATYIVSEVSETARSNHRQHVLMIGPGDDSGSGLSYTPPF